MNQVSSTEIIFLALFCVIFILMGVPPFNQVRVPMQMGGSGRVRRGLHWFWNLLALVCWAAAWLVYPATRAFYVPVDRPDWMIIPGFLLFLLGVAMVIIGLSRNWRKGPMPAKKSTAANGD